MSAPSTIAEVGIILGHMQEQLARLISLGERSATKEEVKAGDDSLGRRLDTAEADVRALRTEVRALQDAKTATDSLVSTVKWVLGLGGASLLAAIAKFFLSQP